MVKILKISFFSLLLSIVPISLYAATLSISPTSGTFEVGDRVTVRVLVSTSAPINAVSSTVSFPTSIFSVESVSKAGSFLNFWVSEPNFNQGVGELQLEGVTLGGFNGGTGTVVTTILRAVKVGSGSITFKSGQILANDGQGTDVTDGKTGATYSVEAAQVETKPVSKPISKPVPKPEVVAPEPVQQAPTLNSPEIVLATKYGEQAISGTSDYPRAQVLLTFVTESGVKIFITGTTDDSGGFLMLVPQTLKHGVYRTYAVVVQENLDNSHTSNEILVTIGNIFSDIGGEIKLALLLLILTLIYLIVRTYYYFRKNKKLKFFVKKEAQEAENVVHKSFKIIREDVGSNKEIRKDLDEAEDLISKEIKDIEKS